MARSLESRNPREPKSSHTSLYSAHQDIYRTTPRGATRNSRPENDPVAPWPMTVRTNDRGPRANTKYNMYTTSLLPVIEYLMSYTIKYNPLQNQKDKYSPKRSGGLRNLVDRSRLKTGIGASGKIARSGAPSCSSSNNVFRAPAFSAS